MGLAAEAAAIFVMGIDQKDAQVRSGIENFLQDNGNAARLANPGGANDGKMPAYQMVESMCTRTFAWNGRDG